MEERGQLHDWAALPLYLLNRADLGNLEKGKISTQTFYKKIRQPGTLIIRTVWMAIMLRETNANKKD